MGLRPITINTPRDQEPHLFSQDDACIYESIFGNDCVFDMGNKFRSQTLSNNKIRLSDGVLQVGGHIARIKSGDYEDVTIANGVSGKKRADIILCKFTTNGKVDNMEIIVKQGVSGSTYSDPALTQNNLYTGGQVREMPLYRVKIDGLSIVAVEQMFHIRSREQYDVGDLYFTTNKANPALKFGGTWELFGKGRMLVCVDESQPEFNTVKKTGGSKTHTLSVAEIPSHTHTTNPNNNVLINSPVDYGLRYGASGDRLLATTGTPINNTGGNQPHNNMSPYITCYTWIRTA